MTRNRASFSRRALALVDKVIAPHFPVMLLATAVIIVALGHPIRSAAEFTINCPLGTYDMLDWMTLDSDLRATYHLEGTSNPLYTVMAPGKDRKSTRLNSSHVRISYAVFCLKKKKKKKK